MKISTLLGLFILPFFYILSEADTIYLPLTDNMKIESNTSIKIAGGNYIFADNDRTGVIQVIGKENVEIDGDSVEAAGADYKGYFIKVMNSRNVLIKNFKYVKNYFYGAYFENSLEIRVENCNFSENKIDSSGWINIWTDASYALGGGLLFNYCSKIKISDNIMKYQNDGAALYHCDSALIEGNDFAWNTSYGIRMYFTDSCIINNNDCSNVNRPQTDPSDCAALLMLVSNENLITSNNLSNSGDGVFLGQYQYSDIPNNNTFINNDCSGSPHNAIEATFAGGNIFKSNKCNNSQYGFWNGYSFDNVIDSNEINNNQVAGIAIEWGYNNQITHNTITGNPVGIQLFLRKPIISGYDQKSEYYNIQFNTFSSNLVSVYLEETENTSIRNNEFINNHSELVLLDTAASDEYSCHGDSITNNNIRGTAKYICSNFSPDDVYAARNTYWINDESILACKFYDKASDPGMGTVTWHPYNGEGSPDFELQPPGDLAEPPAEWTYYIEECGWHGLAIPTSIEFDYEVKKVGQASVKLTTGNGWYVYSHYRPAGGKMARWDLSKASSMNFWVKGMNTNDYGFQYCRVVLGNECGGYYVYTGDAAAVLNPGLTDWFRVTIPLKGTLSWTRTAEGYSEVSLSDISYMEIQADTWGVGFILWIDGLEFDFTQPVEDENNIKGDNLEILPNPAGENSIIRVRVSGNDNICLKIMDLYGRAITILHDGILAPGEYNFPLPSKYYPNGIYCVLCGNYKELKIKEFVLIK